MTTVDSRHGQGHWRLRPRLGTLGKHCCQGRIFKKKKVTHVIKCPWVFFYKFYSFKSMINLQFFFNQKRKKLKVTAIPKFGLRSCHQRPRNWLVAQAHGQKSCTAPGGKDGHSASMQVLLLLLLLLLGWGVLRWLENYGTSWKVLKALGWCRWFHILLAFHGSQWCSLSCHVHSCSLSWSWIWIDHGKGMMDEDFKMHF